MAQQRYTRRRIGDRRDGRRLRTLGSVFQLTPFFMRQPCDAVSSFTDTADVGVVEQWVEQAHSAGYEDMSPLHVYIAAYVRTLALFPALNRFVAGRFLYARDYIDVILSSGRNGSADTGALTIKIHLLPSDTVFDVCRKISAQMSSIKADEDANRIERLADTLIKTPRFVLRGATGIMRWLDYHGWLGVGWTDRSPFHGSVVISDEGAYALPPISRSLNSMGCLPMSISFGRRQDAVEITPEGKAERRRNMNYTVTVDARIADNAYVGLAFKYFRYYLSHPDALEDAPDRINEDAL